MTALNDTTQLRKDRPMQKRLKFLLVLLFSQLAFVGMSHAQFEDRAPPTKSGSEFTVENTSKFKVRVQVFLSDDLTCLTPKFSRSIDAGETKTISCRNDDIDFNRCKIRVRKTKNSNVICKDLRNTCQKGAIRMRNGSEITIRDDPKAKSKVVCEHGN